MAVPTRMWYEKYLRETLLYPLNAERFIQLERTTFGCLPRLPEMCQHIDAWYSVQKDELNLQQLIMNKTA
jgi:hypothetical protein